MQKKWMKRSAFTAYPAAKNGFTFITTIMMISILALTLPFLSYSLQIVKPHSSYDELSVHEFFRFIRDELMQSTTISIADNKLYLTQEDEKIAIINHYENLIRRQVDQRGHEVFLRDVADIHFSEHSYGIKIIITDLEGKTYEKAFAFYN